MAPPTVGKQVFLRVTTATTTVMQGMTSEDTTGQKAADGRKKKSGYAGKKTDAYCPCQRKEEDRQWPANAAFQAGRRNMGKTGENQHESNCFCTGVAGLFLPPKADFLYLRLFCPPTGRRGWGWRRMSESVLSMTLPTATNAKGAALKSRKSFCIYITLIMHTTTARDTFFLPFRLTMSIIMRTFAPIYIIRYGKTE